jgi:predicted NAD/FAD-binding protein
MERKRIAIVGSGISGISTLWTLRNTGHEVHLFEAADRLGGHTNTVNWKHSNLPYVEDVVAKLVH